MDATFPSVEKEMCGLDWDRLHKEYGDKKYVPAELDKQIQGLLSDPAVKNRKGVFEYVLGGCSDKSFLDVRFFDEQTKRKAYQKQTGAAEREGVSNCPLCAVSGNANAQKIWAQKEMEADHVTAWAKGGETSAENCEMLCKTHNRAKGNA